MKLFDGKTSWLKQISRQAPLSGHISTSNSSEIVKTCQNNVEDSPTWQTKGTQGLVSRVRQPPIYKASTMTQYGAHLSLPGSDMGFMQTAKSGKLGTSHETC